MAKYEQIKKNSIHFYRYSLITIRSNRNCTTSSTNNTNSVIDSILFCKKSNSVESLEQPENCIQNEESIMSKK